VRTRHATAAAGAPAPTALSLWLCLIFPWGVSAAGAAGIGLQPDVRLLIDASGSMQEADPENLRVPALELMVRLLPAGARAGIWSFAAEVAVLVPHGEIDQQWRAAAVESVAGIESAGASTNIPAALAAASWDLGQMDPAYRTSIVLLTDGTVDVSESPVVNASASRSLLRRVATELGSAGIPVHTIALGDEVDWALLRSFAQITGGIAERVENADELPAIFLQTLEMVAPAARVPVADSRFRIDDSVEAFSALIFFGGKDTRVGLLGPTGVFFQPRKSPAGVQWLRSPQYALVTVTAPQPGDWQLKVPELASARVMVNSGLRLEVGPPPSSLPAGRSAELALRLREGDRLLTDPEVLGQFGIAVEVQDPRGGRAEIDVSGSYPLPADGEYRVALPPFEEPGRYRLMARVSDRTLQRELPMYVEVEATPDKATLTTRGSEVPQQDLWAPLLALAAAVLVSLLWVWLILRRRKQRRLELWERRARQSDTRAAEDAPAAAVGATTKNESDGAAGPPGAAAP
jgi:hypothetical protein